MLQPVIIGKPEAAREKHAFSRRQAVNLCLGSITQPKAGDHEFPLDCREGAAHALVVCRQKADERDKQQTRVELGAAEALCEGVAAAVEAQLANRRVHTVAEFPPGTQRRLEVEPFGIAHRAIQSHPRHDLGKRKVATTTSHFPDTLVRLLPDLLKMLDQLLLQCPARPDRSKTERSPLVDGVDELAVHVELKLSGSCVANAHWPGTPVAGQPRHFPLDELPLAG